jgi:hypothetical protein
MVADPAATPVTRPLEFTVATPVLLDDQLTVLFVAFPGATVAVNCWLLPALIDAVVGETVTPVTGTFAVVTVIALVAVRFPSWVVTVIVAEPCDTAVTSPVEFTVATEVLLDDQLTFLFVALAGETVAVNWRVLPATTEADVGETLTPVTGMVDVVTVMALVAVRFPSCVVTVIVADPCPTPVTTPLEFTVATPVLLDDQLTFLLVALAGETVAISCCVPPTLIDAEVGETLTPVTATGG